MADYIYSLVLLIVVVLAIELHKAYHHIPKRELRLRAREGDRLAEQLYRAAAYDVTVEVFLWLVVGLAAAGSLILFRQVAPLWLDFLAVVLFLWLVMAALPRIRVTRVSLYIARWLTPGVVVVLNFIHPAISKIENLLNLKKAPKPTGLYDKASLVELLNKQKQQSDNRIDQADLKLAIRALKLPEQTAGHICTTWSKLAKAYAQDPMGPIVLDEMHKSGQKFIPVLESKSDKRVVGMVDLASLNLSATGQLKDLMSANLYFLNEDDRLDAALKAFAVTGSQVFVVLDAKERPFGTLTLKDLLTHLTGKVVEADKLVKPEVADVQPTDQPQ